MRGLEVSTTRRRGSPLESSTALRLLGQPVALDVALGAVEHGLDAVEDRRLAVGDDHANAALALRAAALGVVELDLQHAFGGERRRHEIVLAVPRGLDLGV